MTADQLSAASLICSPAFTSTPFFYFRRGRSAYRPYGASSPRLSGESHSIRRRPSSSAWLQPRAVLISPGGTDTRPQRSLFQSGRRAAANFDALATISLPAGLTSDSFNRKRAVVLLEVSHEKLIRFLSYLGSLLVFPLVVAGVVGLLGHSATLGIKTFLLIELGMAILSPLLNALIASGGKSPHHHRGK